MVFPYVLQVWHVHLSGLPIVESFQVQWYYAPPSSLEKNGEIVWSRLPSWDGQIS